ncbi:MAG: hypothetical protein LBT34_00195 [Clostridiales Family XIII bacterium]|nr:hypothetical protein [Clostridiales Family XIII bacterium]
MGLTDWLKKQRLEYRAQFVQRNAYVVASEANSQRATARKQAKYLAEQQGLLVDGKRNPGKDDPIRALAVAQNRVDELNARKKVWEDSGLDVRTYQVNAEIAETYGDPQEFAKATTGQARSIGGFFGRLFSGRLTQASRDEQAEAVKKSREKPLYSDRKETERFKLEKNIKQREAEVAQAEAAQREAEAAQREAEAAQAAAAQREAEAAREDIRRNIGIDFQKVKADHLDEPPVAFKSVLEGGKYVSEKENGEIVNELPVSDNQKLDDGAYQLGWNSVAWFTRDEDGVFHGVKATKNINCTGTKNETDEYGKLKLDENGNPRLIKVSLEAEVADFEGQEFNQIVTRGVDTCTAAIVSKGDLYCFMHLDAPTIGSPEKRSEILGEIQKTFDEHGPKGQQTKLCVSCLAPMKGQEENSGRAGTFAAECIDICYKPPLKADNDPEPVVQVLNRGATDKKFNNNDPESYLSHMEFGIHGKGVIFGDKSEFQPILDADGLNVAVDSNRNGCIVDAFDMKAQTTTFAFSENAPQKIVNECWSAESHPMTVDDGKEIRQNPDEFIIKPTPANIDAKPKRMSATMTDLSGAAGGKDANKSPLAFSTSNIDTKVKKINPGLG